MKKITFSKEQLEWIINEYTNNHLSMQKIGENQEYQRVLFHEY